ncbi:MAG: hypothetical protein HRU15_14695 [Planctomycetes bacterium]|nr:hypothetical protein [Planctomycetota bacterium]
MLAQSFDCFNNIGIAEVDITPPVGAYNRCWGAATHQTAEGIHMPFYATAMVIGDQQPIVIIGFDCTWGVVGGNCRQRIADALETSANKVLLCMSHTHSGLPIGEIDPAFPGADLQQQYAKELPVKLLAVAQAAAMQRQPAIMQSGYGRCDLARNRDLLHEGSYVTGFNPDGLDDDTVLSTRIVNDAGELMAVMVNYACHPTTLAWENKKLSPDYIGMLRETIRDTLAVPMIFLQGCSGDLGPANGFTGDTEVADNNGRQLAYAVLSSLQSMPTAGTHLQLEQVKKSGADLAVWRERDAITDGHCVFKEATLTWVIREDLLKSAEVEELLKQNPDNAEAERLRRKLSVRKSVGEGDNFEFKFWLARFGNILFVSFPGEAYCKMQSGLRAAFPGYTVICVNVCEGWIGYIVPAHDYAKPSLYTVWQTPLAEGIFEALFDLCVQELKTLCTGQLAVS